MKAAAIGVSTIILTSTAAFAELEWKVLDPFRLIDYRGSPSRFEISNNQTALSFVTDRLSNKKTAELPPIHSTRLNIPREEYIFPTHHKVSAKITVPPSGECTWSYQGFSKTLRCDKTIEFDAITQFSHGDATLRVHSLSDNYHEEILVMVTDRLVLGLGDSYASGEGNPDIPTIPSKSGLRYISNNMEYKFSAARWLQHPEIWVQKDAEWLDKQCHRSMLSQHVLAGLRLASFSKHETLTLLPLACSGAEILDGILIPQKRPPGGGDYVSDSQLNTAVKSLCRSGKSASKPFVFYRGFTGSSEMKKVKANIYICDGEIRRPDAILLSVGGNDVGFAPVLKWASTPKEGRNIFGTSALNITRKILRPVCPKYTGESVCYKNKPVAIDRIRDWLPKYYHYLAQNLSSAGLTRAGENIFLTAYPNPSFIEDGKRLCDLDRSADALQQANSKIPKLMKPEQWQTRIRSEELADINKALINPLFKTMKSTASKYGWTFIDSYLDTIVPHGICAGFARTDHIKNAKGESESVPLYPHLRNGKWYPSPPWEEWAYESKARRWFRNTNDSVMFQSDRAVADITGSFHPDYRVHALIADKIYSEVSKSWLRISLQGNLP
ncbi:hypothetical protein EHI8A_184120 [Entamoeba histolytica HM-1:IMSS-B]|uniref:SGNH hydrolase-type esterase domain-containing protein n=1 Tax=Entamoeba histolytica HM-1:IMSS-B TaxID=885319 RepID=M3UL65_ENTH1|nr:hypothetical protein EHI8A_184120 [Entamoeba histolytica HM-1:IMSS-B]